VTAVFETLVADESYISFVDKRRDIERVIRALMRHVVRGELAKFVIDQREKLPRGERVTGFDGI
jgi:hypothetical protein